MWSHQSISTGISIAQGITSFIGKARQAADERAWQEYNNRMTRIADGQNQNSITTNHNMAIERSTIQGFEISKSSYETRAKVEAAAAALGAEGGSLNQTLFAVDRNAAAAQHNRKFDLEAQIAGFENQRRTSSFQAIQQIDHSPIPGPNPISAMLGIGANAFSTWDKYQT